MAFYEALLIGGSNQEDGQPADAIELCHSTSKDAIQPTAIVEVCRSFSYKLNLKNPDGSPTYESCDFFASRKMQCAAHAVPMVTAELIEQCVVDVRDSIDQFQKARAARLKAPRERRLT